MRLLLFLVASLAAAADLPLPGFSYLPDGRIAFSSPAPVIRYHFEDRDPDKSSGVYFGPVDVPVGRVLRARAFSADGQDASPVLTIAGRPAPTSLLPVTQNRDFKNYDWATRHRAILALNQQQPPALVLLGDSITHFWGGQPADARARGPLSFEKFFGQWRTVNLGYGWDRTENVLWRLRNGELDGISPRVVMVMIGTNNMGLNTAEEIAAGITAICDEIHLRLPRAHILLNAIFPRGAKPDAMRDKITATNRLIAPLDGTRNITYIDPGHVFLEPDGTIAPAIMNDYLHPTEAGYERWGAAIAPVLNKLMR